MKDELEQKLFEEFPKLYRGKDDDMTQSLMGMGFSVKDGWYDIIYDLSEKVVNFCEENGYNIPKAFQVKEKFGGLRFYFDGVPDKKIFDFVREAEQRSLETCEVCGEDGEPREGGWIKTLCDEHHGEVIEE